MDRTRPRAQRESPRGIIAPRGIDGRYRFAPRGRRRVPAPPDEAGDALVRLEAERCERGDAAVRVRVEPAPLARVPAAPLS